MDKIIIIGTLTLIVSWLIKLIGFPHQIRNIIVSKDSSGVSLPLMVLSFFSYCLWTTYGILKKDYIVALAQSIGILVGGITIIIIIKYRKKE